ncbi:hypothetical protein CR513_02145, partial [Mucuna pruriens]
MNFMYLSFVLLFAFSTQLLLGASDASPKQVVDTEGKIVRVGVDYYIRPVPTTPCDGRGPCVVGSGFVLVAKSVNQTCPLNVVVVEGFRGQAVTFTPVNPKKGVIRISTDLNIKTSLNTSCNDSTVWKLDDFDDSTGQWFVTTGGVLGNPSKDTLSNWFKIEEYDDDYKLVFCPNVCNFCKPLCKNVGVFRDGNGNQRVALTDAPYIMTLVTLLVLVVGLSTKALIGEAGPAPEQVVDTSGKKVRAGGNYYIVPAASPNEGGLSLASTGEDCPLDVIAVDGYQGQPLTFIPINDKKGVIRVSTDLNIYFSTYTSCPQSTVWKLKDYDYSTAQWFVTTGGVLGNPGSQTVANWFKIDKYEDAYKLVYCPNVCNDCSYQCSDIGIYQDQYGKRLALSSEPYKVQFQQA